MFTLRRYLAKVFSLSNHFDSLFKNVAYSFRMGLVPRTLTIKTIDPIHTNFTFDVSESVLCESLISSEVVNNAIVDDENLNNVNSTTMDQLQDGCAPLVVRHQNINTYPSLPVSGRLSVSRTCCV